MTKHIGIVGVSAEGAALCYRTICREGTALLGRHNHPEVTLHTCPLADYMRPIYSGHWDEVGELLLASADKLKKGGADVLICPDNTVHTGVDLILDRSPLPWLHIAEEVANVAESRGFRRLLILGTKYLAESEVYPKRLRPRGIDFVIPSAPERGRVDDIIMDELVNGRFEDPARDYLKGLIAKALESGADAVVLGCTEIPLLIGETDSPLPILDSTRILARAALRVSIT